MTSATAFLLIGLLLLAMGVTRSAIHRLPVTTAMVYLAVGLIGGPALLGAYHFNPLKQSETLELITELAVLLSLYTAGAKMSAPLSLPRWQNTLRLATLALGVTIALMSAFGVLALGLPLGAALLLAATLAPTDPVLAGDVQARPRRTGTLAPQPAVEQLAPVARGRA